MHSRCLTEKVTCSGVSQVHPEGLQQRDRRRQVAIGTPHARGLRDHGGVARSLLDPRPPGEDPLYRSTEWAQGITTAGSWDIRTAHACHACKSLETYCLSNISQAVTQKMPNDFISVLKDFDLCGQTQSEMPQEHMPDSQLHTPRDSRNLGSEVRWSPRPIHCSGNCSFRQRIRVVRFFGSVYNQRAEATCAHYGCYERL